MGDEPAGMYPECAGVTRTVEVSGLTKGDFVREFEKHSISMNAQGMALFEEIPFSGSESRYSVETVELQTRQLGFGDGATTHQICERVGQLGLGPCPLELGPYLRLQYLEQPEGHWIVVFSKMLSEQSDGPHGFYLRRLEDGLWLRGYTAGERHMWDPEDHFIFGRLDQ